MTDTGPTTPRRHVVTVHGRPGARLSGLAAGPPDAGDRPVLLLHGIPSSAELWRPVMTRLAAAGHRVLAPDLLGYGDSGWVDPGRRHAYGLARSAEVLGAWLQATDRFRVWLVGHDLGGGVAQILAVRHPERLRGLSLIDAVSDDAWPVPPVRLLRLVARAGLYPRLAAAAPVPNPVTDRLLDSAMAAPAAVPPRRRTAVFWDGKVHDADGRRRFAAHLRSLDPAGTAAVFGRLGALDVPTHLVWGRADRYLPWRTDGVRLRDALGDPAVDLLDDAGHFVPAERPAACARALLARLGEG